MYTSFPGITSSAVTSLAIFNDTLVVGTANGAVYFSVNDTVAKAIPLLNNMSISAFRVDNGKLYLLTSSGSNFLVESLGSILDVPQTVTLNSDVQGIQIISTSSLWVSTASKGLAHLSGSIWNYSYPNGPNSNFFSSLAIDSNGVLWAASGSSTTAGFYQYNASSPENAQWKNFPVFGVGNGCYRVSLGPNGSVWISSWGDGVCEVVGDSIKRVMNYFSRPSLPGARATIPTYVVTGMVAVDGQGKIWISNRVEDNGRSLLRLDNDTSATFFDNQYNPTDGWFHSMVIDQYGTKWLAGDLPWETPGRGLYLFNENPSLLYGIQTTPNGWGRLTSIDGLQSDIVLAFAVDLEGALWIGTSQGITIISNPQYPKQMTMCFALQANEIIQSIAIDALNNKWMGTKEGVFVVNSDGYAITQCL